jgi:hypothetical protein
MPAHSGPNTLGESNLVFAYDTGDVKNSYIGQPTTNLANTNAARTMVLHYGSHAMTFTDAPEKGDGWKKVTITTVNGDNNRLSQFPYITSAIGQRTYSVEYDVGALTTYSWKVDGSSGYSIIPITGQGKFQFTVTHDSVGVFALFLINETPATGLSNIIYYRYYQVEDKPTATPFVNGTRSATQGLLPLVGNSTIDLSTVSFDSNAQMIFDGTDDKIQDISVVHSYLNSSAIEVVITPEIISRRMTVGGYRHNSGYSSPTIGMVYIDSDNKFYASVITTAEVYRFVSSTTTISANQTYHVVLNKNTLEGILQMYVNGGLEGTQTFDAATYGQWASTGSYIGSDIIDLGKSFNISSGQGWGGDFLDGKIHNFKLYSRTLTAGEVRQNYLQYKTRFNLS